MPSLRSMAAAASICAALILNSSTALAQTARSGGGASAQLIQQMQQLASERTAMQEENARLKKELEGLKKDRDSLKSSQQLVDRRAKESATALAHSAAERQATEQELAQSKAKMQELIGKMKETIQTLRTVESEGTAAKQSLAKRDQELTLCAGRNVALYDINKEVLARLENQGVWSRMAQAEPFTKIKRAQLENLIDDYKDRAQVQRMAPADKAPAGGAPVAKDKK